MSKFSEVFLTESKKEDRVFLAPEKVKKSANELTIFLAGSIEMGKAEDWQTKVTKMLTKEFDNIIIVNPRRKDWDSSWEQTIKNKQFNEQVTWELSNIEASDIMLVYFDAKTQSPITLAELGYACAKFPSKVVVCCPEGFFRKGNVDIMCHRYGVKQIESLDELIDTLKSKFKKLA
jgi:hypothetical protein